MTANLQNVLSTGTGFAAAGGLMHTLVPQAEQFCFYNTRRTCLWSSTGSDDLEIDSEMAALPPDIFRAPRSSRDLLRRSLPSGRTAVLLFLQGQEKQTQEKQTQGKQGRGALVVVFGRSSGETPTLIPDQLETILFPAAQ